MKFSYFVRQSLLSRKKSVLLLSLVICLSVLIPNFMYRFLKKAQHFFSQSANDVHLLVGQKGSGLTLTLHSLFLAADAPGFISSEVYDFVKTHEFTKWAVPLTSGDSYQGFRVFGTERVFFNKFSYLPNQRPVFEQGFPFQSSWELVVGAKAAQELNLALGRTIHISHGNDPEGINPHLSHAFVISGILQESGTLLDRSLFIPIESYHLLHNEGATSSKPALSSILVQLKEENKSRLFQNILEKQFQGSVDSYSPAFVLRNFWGILDWAKKILFVALVSSLLLNLFVMTLVQVESLRQREKELALMRCFGARKRNLFAIILSESLLSVLLGYGTAIGFMIFVGGILEPINPLFSFLKIEHGEALGFLLVQVGLQIIAIVILALFLTRQNYKRALPKVLADFS